MAHGIGSPAGKNDGITVDGDRVRAYLGYDGVAELYCWEREGG